MEQMRFDGADYDHARDSVRLTGQLLDIWEFVKDSGWYSLADISRNTGHPAASVSAQLRHLRKERFGGHTVEKKYEGNGLYLYKVIPNA